MEEPCQLLFPFWSFWVAKWPVMPFPIEYLLTSEVTLKSLFPPPLKCKHSLWQLLLTFHLEDNKSYFRKCGKNRWLHWCFAASKVSCQEHQNLQTFKTLLLSSPHPRKTFNFKFQLGFSSNGFKLKLSHWKIGKKKCGSIDPNHSPLDPLSCFLSWIRMRMFFTPRVSIVVHVTWIVKGCVRIW